MSSEHQQSNDQSSQSIQLSQIYNTWMDFGLGEINDNLQENESNSQISLNWKQFKKINKKKEFLIQKQFKIQYIPTLKHIDHVESIFFVGEIYILFDFDNRHYEKTHISALNNFKRISETILHKRSRFLEIKLEHKASSLKDFILTAKNLENYPDKDVHEFGILLQIYQKFCFTTLEMIKNQQMYLKTLTQQLIDQKKQIYNEKKFDFLNNFNQDEFIYAYELANNYNTLEFEIKSIFISEPLLVLLGTTLEQYERYIHRFGISEFIDSKCQLKFITYQLKSILRKFVPNVQNLPILQSFDEKQTVEATIYTFDNIQISTKFSCYKVLPQDGICQCQDINVDADMLMVTKFEIETSSIQQLMQIRQNQQSKQVGIYDQGYMNEIDFSLDYQLQTEVFFDAAHKIHKLFKKKNKRSSYRIMTDDEKLNLNQYNIHCKDSEETNKIYTQQQQKFRHNQTKI